MSISDAQLEAEINSLEARRKQLIRLSTLRAEVQQLESEEGFKGGSVAALKIIGAEVCKVFGVPENMIWSRIRTEEIVIPRMTVIYLAVTYFHLGYSQLARIKGRDHSGMAHARKAIGDRMTVDPDFKLKVERALASCRAAFFKVENESMTTQK